MPKSTQKKASPKAASTKTDLGIPAFDGQVKADFDLSLEDLFISELKDTYWAENHLVKSLPKMIDAAGGSELKQALTEHLEITKGHSTRLEEALGMLNESIVAKKCDAMEGLTISGEHVIENTVAGTPIRDTGIIMSGLKVENFEITTYTGLIKTASKLGRTDIADLLQQTLDEESEAAENLSAILEATDTAI